jgi:polynucleotide 5'-hydroxyl-kinase GRC3/NOL9
MSAIAARKARLALQVEAQQSASSSSSDQAGPSSQILNPKRKALPGKVARPTKVSRQKQHREGTSKTLHNVHDLQELNGGDDNEDDDDSSDESNASTDVEIEERAEDVPKRPSIFSLKPAYSSFTPITEGKRKNWHSPRHRDEANKNGSLIIGLAPGQTLLFVGKARLKVLDGQCSIAGAHLTAVHRSVSIFAPQNSPLPVIKAHAGSPTCKAYPEYGLNELLFSAVLKFTSSAGTDIDDIAMACPLVRSGCFTLEGVSPPLPGFYPLLQPTRGLASAFLPPSWEQALTSLADDQSPSLYMIKGPKRAGKSTFSRLLLNRLVSIRQTSVAYLETDLGQAEFGPPGMVALHLFGSLSADVEGSSDLVIGPSWTSLRNPLRSHFLGDTTPRDDPSSYNNSIADLVRYYNQHLKIKGIPLIVNTQGWVKGLGADLLFNLERLLQPTHVFDMMQYDEDGLVQQFTSPSAQPLNNTVIMRLEAAPVGLTRDRGLNAVEARTLNLVSYFYSVRLPGPGNVGDPQWDFSLPLVQQRPYVIDVHQGLQGGLFVPSKGASVDKKLHLMALNGSIVGIVSTSQHFEKLSSGDSKSSIWRQALSRDMPSLQSSNLLSLAIVRSIDIDKGEIYLITPLSLQHLQSSHSPNKHLYLIKGAIEVPIWLSLNFSLIEASQSSQPSASSQLFEGVPLSDVPFLTFAQQSSLSKDQIIGQEKRKVRRNILRRSQRGGPE